MDLITDEDTPLNLSLKGRSRSHGIWSPGSLCEQEIQSKSDIKPDSSVGSIIDASKQAEHQWRSWETREKESHIKITSIGSSGEKTFTVSRILLKVILLFLKMKLFVRRIIKVSIVKISTSNDFQTRVVAKEKTIRG